MKIRYTKQYNTDTCGPIALINILKWSGQKVSVRKNLKSISSLCGCEKGEGTLPSMFMASLILLDFGYKKIKNRLPDFDKVLDDGQIILVDQEEDANNEDGHYYLVVGKTKKTFKCVNLYIGKSISIVNRKAMFNLIRNTKKQSSKCYAIRRLK